MQVCVFLFTTLSSAPTFHGRRQAEKLVFFRPGLNCKYAVMTSTDGAFCTFLAFVALQLRTLFHAIPFFHLW